MSTRRVGLAVTVLFVLAGFLTVPAAAQDEPVIVIDRITIPLSDGTEIAACRLRPAELTRHPVVLEWTNYTIESDNAGPAAGCPPQGQDLVDRLVPDGFVWVAANTRGVARSGGGAADQWSRANGIDGAEVIAWLDNQDWSTGRVGIWGCSSSSMEGWQVVVQDPPDLDAAVMSCWAEDAYRGAFYPGGIRNYTVFTYLARVGVDVDYEGGQLGESLASGDPTPLERIVGDIDVTGQVVTTTTDAPFWRNQSTDELLDGPRAPVYAFGSWHDFFGRGAPEFAMRHLQEGDRLLLSPGYHGSGLATTGRWSWADRMADWFRWHLVDLPADPSTPDPFADEPEIVWWLHERGFQPSGAAGELPDEGFHGAASWPLPETTWQRWFLDGTRSGTAPLGNDGSLLLTAPDGAQQGSVVTFPTPSVAVTTDPRGFDQAAAAPAQLEQAGGALTFTSAPLESDLVVAGPITADLFVSSTAPDQDWIVRLLDVAPDGSTTDITNGWLKASFRDVDLARSLTNDAGEVIRPYHPHDQHVDVPVGEVVPLQIELWQAPARLLAGDRLRVVVTNQSTPWYFQETPPSVNTLHHDVDNPSSILLPVVPAAALTPPFTAPAAPAPTGGGATDAPAPTADATAPPAAAADDVSGSMPTTGGGASALALGLVLAAVSRGRRRTR